MEILREPGPRADVGGPQSAISAIFVFRAASGGRTRRSLYCSLIRGQAETEEICRVLVSAFKKEVIQIYITFEVIILAPVTL